MTREKSETAWTPTKAIACTKSAAQSGLLMPAGILLLWYGLSQRSEATRALAFQKTQSLFLFRCLREDFVFASTVI